MYLESVANWVLLKRELRFCHHDGTPLLKREFLPGAPSTCPWSLSPHWPLLLLPFAHSAAATLAFPLFPTPFPRHLPPQRFCKWFSLHLRYFFPRYLYILFFSGSLLRRHNFVRPSGHFVSDYSPWLTCFISCPWFIFSPEHHLTFIYFTSIYLVYYLSSPLLPLLENKHHDGRGFFFFVYFYLMVTCIWKMHTL